MRDARVPDVAALIRATLAIQTVSTQTAEDTAVCLGLRALAPGRRLACLHESLAGCPALGPEDQATLAQFLHAVEEVIQASTPSCAFSLTKVEPRGLAK
jgi:hypothetical protein